MGRRDNNEVDLAGEVKRREGEGREVGLTREGRSDRKGRPEVRGHSEISKAVRKGDNNEVDLARAARR